MRRGLTLTRIILRHHKNFRERIQKGQEHGKIGRCHYSTLAVNTLYRGDMKQRRVILTLVSLYREWETRTLL
jgi:hypothetical protein